MAQTIDSHIRGGRYTAQNIQHAGDLCQRTTGESRIGTHNEYAVLTFILTPNALSDAADVSLVHKFDHVGRILSWIRYEIVHHRLF